MNLPTKLVADIFYMVERSVFNNIRNAISMQVYNDYQIQISISRFHSQSNYYDQKKCKKLFKSTLKSLQS